MTNRDGDHHRRGGDGGYFRLSVFTVTAAICFSIAVRRSSGRISFWSSLCQAVLVFSTVSRTISHTGLAGRRAVSVKRRIWSTVISLRLWLPPKFRASLSPGI